MDEIVEKLRKVCNSNSTPDAKALAKAILGQHRTTQQSIIRFLVKTLIEMGKACDAGYDVDLRNKAWIEFCKRLDVLVEEENINFPMV